MLAQWYDDICRDILHGSVVSTLAVSFLYDMYSHDDLQSIYSRSSHSASQKQNPNSIIFSDL